MDARLCLWSLFLLTCFPLYGIFSRSTEVLGRLVSLCWVWPVEPEQLGSWACAFCVGSRRLLEFNSRFPIFFSQPPWAAFWSHRSHLQAPPLPRPAATSAAGFGARPQAWKTASSPGGKLGPPCCEGHPGGQPGGCPQTPRSPAIPEKVWKLSAQLRLSLEVYKLRVQERHWEYLGRSVLI